MMQDLLRTLGFTPDTVLDREFGAIRALIEALPETHPFAAARSRHPDWRSDEGLVDLLLHVQDRAYSLPEILGCLKGAGLKLQKLLFRARYDPRYTPLSAPGLAKRLGRLNEPARLAAGELVRASIKKHAFVACHAGRAPETYEIDVSPNGWGSLIPILAPGISGERPTDARPAFRLSWPHHEDRNIFVDVPPDLIGLIEAFDGVRTVRDAIAAAGEPGPAKKATKKINADIAQVIREMADADLLEFRVRP